MTIYILSMQSADMFYAGGERVIGAYSSVIDAQNACELANEASGNIDGNECEYADAFFVTEYRVQ